MKNGVLSTNFATINSVKIPSAPWHLGGEAVGLMASPFVFRLLVRYDSSPVGAYNEHALVKFKYEKGLLAPHVFQMSVDLEESKIGGRTIWGFPKTLEDLSWTKHNGSIEFRRGTQQFNFRSFGPKIPLGLSFFTLQKLKGKWVKVPGKLKGKCQVALRGKQLAMIVTDFSLVINPAQKV
jgi:hypothetical protein